MTLYNSDAYPSLKSYSVDESYPILKEYGLYSDTNYGFGQNVLDELLTTKHFSSFSHNQQDFLLGRVNNAVREILEDDSSYVREKVMETISESFAALGLSLEL